MINVNAKYNHCLVEHNLASEAYLEVDTNQGTWWALGPTIISRGVWGHAPQKILNFMGALRCFLVHFGAGVLTEITNTTQQKEDYRNSI